MTLAVSETVVGDQAKAAGLALMAYGLFSTHDAIIKNLGGTYSPIQLVFFSVLFSFPLTTMHLMRDLAPGNLIPKRPLWMLARSAAAVATALSAFYAFTVLPLAQTYAILFAAPLLITILSVPMLGETVRLRRWIGVLAGLVGVLIVLRPGTSELGLGHAAALCAACCGAFASVAVRKLAPHERPVVLILYPMMANFVLMACLVPFAYEPMPLRDLVATAAVALLAFAAMLLVIAAYKIGEASTVAPMQYSQIIWASVYGFAFFDEVPDSYTILGAAVVIGSGVYLVYRERYAGTSRTTPVLRNRPRFETATVTRVDPLVAEPTAARSGIKRVRRRRRLAA